MAQVYTSLTLGITSQAVTPIIQMPQGDNGRGLDVFITDDIITEQVGEVDNTLSAFIYAEKPSGLKYSIDANSVVRYTGTEAYRIRFNGSDDFAQIIAEEGITTCQICLLSGNEFVSTFEFNIHVKSNPAARINIESEESFVNANQLIASLKEKEKELDGYIKQFEEQMKLTVNVRFGTSEPTVEPGDKANDIYIRVKA